jgi:ketosteroid isomerase-like protein
MRGRWPLVVASMMIVSFALLRPYMPERSTSVVPVARSGPQNPSSEEQLRSLVRDWDAAYASHDTKALSSILADDYEMVDAAGEFISRTDYVIGATSATAFIPDGEAGVSSGLLVRMYGDTAVVTGRSRSKGLPRNRLLAAGMEVVFTDLFVRLGDQWRAVATHATPLGRQ